MSQPDDTPKNLEREIPILAIYRDGSAGYVVEVNAHGEALDAAYAHLATTFARARALARPGSEPGP
jgi:hypothetical protein